MYKHLEKTQHATHSIIQAVMSFHAPPLYNRTTINNNIYNNINNNINKNKNNNIYNNTQQRYTTTYTTKY